MFVVFNVNAIPCDACKGIIELEETNNISEDEIESIQQHPRKSLTCPVSTVHRLKPPATSSVKENLQPPSIAQHSVSTTPSTQINAKRLMENIRNSTNKMILDWYNVMQHVSTDSSVLDQMMREVHSLAFNVQNLIVHVAKNFKTPDIQIQEKCQATESTQHCEKPTQQVIKVLKKPILPTHDGIGSATVDIENLPQCITQVIKALEGDAQNKVSTNNNVLPLETNNSMNTDATDSEAPTPTTGSSEDKKEKDPKLRKKHCPKVDESAIITGKRRRFNFLNE